MKVDKSLFSALPYRPEILRDKNLYAIGHPDLVPVLKKLAKEPDLDLPGQSQVIKEHPNLIVRTSLLTDDNFPWPRQVIKQFRWRGVQNYLASPLKKSKAVKSYLAACHLLKHGLGTPMPLGAVEVRCCGFISSNIYVTETVHGYVDLKTYRDTMPHGKEGMETVMLQLARYIQRLHDSGMLHRDLNLSNFLLRGESEQCSLYLVDLNRARRKNKVYFWARAMDLSRLDLKEWQPLFFNLYCSSSLNQAFISTISRLSKTRRTAWRQVAKRTIFLRQKMGLR